jgi:hypothetical protein
LLSTESSENQNEDLNLQENSVKLLCNLLTDPNTCKDILKNDGIYVIHQSLVTGNKQALKFALGSALNLTLLQNIDDINTKDLLLISGGLAHIMNGVFRAFGQEEYEGVNFGFLAIVNLCNYENNVKLVCAEFGYLETIIQLTKQMFQEKMHLQNRNIDGSG